MLDGNQYSAVSWTSIPCWCHAGTSTRTGVLRTPRSHRFQVNSRCRIPINETLRTLKPRLSPMPSETTVMNSGAISSRNRARRLASRRASAQSSGWAIKYQRCFDDTGPTRPSDKRAIPGNDIPYKHAPTNAVKTSAISLLEARRRRIARCGGGLGAVGSRAACGEGHRQCRPQEQIASPSARMRSA